jgi:hypothetical protein
MVCFGDKDNAVKNSSTTAALGSASTTIVGLIDTISKERGAQNMAAVSSTIPMFTRAYIFDRSLDYATLMMTCFTYESLIHESFTIDCAIVDFGDKVRFSSFSFLKIKALVFFEKELNFQVMSKLKPTVVDGATETTKRPPLTTLNDQCVVYKSVRNQHVAAVFPYLSARAKELQVG